MICPFPLTSCAVAGTKSCVPHTRTSLPHWQKKRNCILNSHSELHAAWRLESFVYSWSLLLPVSPLWFSLSWTSNGRRRKGFVQVTMWPLLVKVQEITPSLHPTPNYPCCVWGWGDTRWATQGLVFVLDLALFAVKLGWRRTLTVRFAASNLGGLSCKCSFR